MAIPPDGAAHPEVTYPSQAAALLQRVPARAWPSGGSPNGHYGSVPAARQEGRFLALAGSAQQPVATSSEVAA